MFAKIYIYLQIYIYIPSKKNIYIYIFLCIICQPRSIGVIWKVRNSLKSWNSRTLLIQSLWFGMLMASRFFETKKLGFIATVLWWRNLMWPLQTKWSSSFWRSQLCPNHTLTMLWGKSSGMPAKFFNLAYILLRIIWGILLLSIP